MYGAEVGGVWCYGSCGTEVEYGATGDVVLRSGTLLRGDLVLRRGMVLPGDCYKAVIGGPSPCEVSQLPPAYTRICAWSMRVCASGLYSRFCMCSIRVSAYGLHAYVLNMRTCLWSTHHRYAYLLFDFAAYTRVYACAPRRISLLYREANWRISVPGPRV
eukprot:3530911-Rhodomonas_salina.1